jgi:amidohydrolase
MSSKFEDNMDIVKHIKGYEDELIALRRDFHANPELGFEEVRTSGIVAELLKKWGYEVHTGIAQTGVVGVLKGKGEGRRIGLRADMDALPIVEQTGLPFSSTKEGLFHGCGHDGHTTMLLGAARYLAETRNFNGTLHVIFQPAEEGLGGARRMIAEGLFERFPCDEIYGLHNFPNGKVGQIGICSGAMLASADFFDIKIKAGGGHAATPHFTTDPIPAAFAIGSALQTIITRNVPALDAMVLSITKIQGGSAYNIIPDEVVMSGTIRTNSKETRALAAKRMREICENVAAAHNVTAEVEIRDIFSVLINAEEQTEVVRKCATELYGEENVFKFAPIMGSEDFADMLDAVPGSYFIVGGPAGPGLHNPAFQFDDSTIVTASALLAHIVETRG